MPGHSFPSRVSALARTGEPYWLAGQREALIRRLQAKGCSPAVLQALEAVPRHVFVPQDLVNLSYEDCALPIADGQTISQPSTVALQTQALQAESGMRVLELGTGSGYQTAVLVHLGLQVFSVERSRSLHLAAARVLAQYGWQATLKLGDGTLGWDTYAPFDRILVTAGGPVVPKALLVQLAVGGRLVIPVGTKTEQQMLAIDRLSQDDFRQAPIGSFKFVPLIGRQGWS
jgi:protein-L-isoaspartate(D-aspartate) O-methyltransferase